VSTEEETGGGSPRYELTGSAKFGVEPHLMASNLISAIGAEVPVRVCMGARLVEEPPPAAVPRLADFFDPARVKLTLPASTNYRAKAARSLSTMLGNDREGDCTIASTGHQAGLWTANDSDSPGEVVMTTQEASATYHKIGGPGDNGLVIRDVLEFWRTAGIPMGGKLHKIDGYAAIDWTNKELVKAAILVFGGLKIGFRCPPQFLQSKDWSYVGPPVTRGRGAWGGHDAPPVDFNEDGPLSSSWARVYQWTWQAFSAYVTEAYVVLSKDWYNSDLVAPCGFDLKGLKDAMDKMSRGVLPDDPAPQPPAPPTPPRRATASPSPASSRARRRRSRRPRPTSWRSTAATRVPGDSSRVCWTNSGPASLTGAPRTASNSSGPAG
jgi:hypothetical protein